MASFSVLLIAVVAMVLVVVSAIIVVTIMIVRVNRGRERDLASNPNLTPCPGCQALISTRAQVCPHCGRPMKR